MTQACPPWLAASYVQAALVRVPPPPDSLDSHPEPQCNWQGQIHILHRNRLESNPDLKSRRQPIVHLLKMIVLRPFV